MFDHAFVLRRASSLYTGVGNERTVLGDAGVFLVTNGMLIKRAGRQIAVDFSGGKAVRRQVERSGTSSCHWRWRGTSRLWRDISAGFSRPSRKRNVGATSVRI